MITTYRLIVSIITIIVVVSATATTTYAFFTSSQTFAGNIITTGDFNFQGTMTDTAGLQVSSLVETKFAPGMTTTRCIFVTNTGNLPGRFKLYRGTDSGDVSTLGNQLQVTGTLNPTTGPCSTMVPAGFGSLTKYATTSTAATVSMTDVNFKSVANTPFKVQKTVAAVPPNQYAVYRIDVTLPSTVTSGSGLTYNTNLELFGIQAEGSDPSTDW